MSDYDPPFWRWPVWVGNNPPLIFKRKSNGTPIDLTGYALRLRVSWPDGTLALNNGDPGFTILPQAGATLGMFQIQLSLAQTRLLPTTVSATYELEQLYAGEERTFLQGEIVASGGVNTDG